MRCRCVRDIVEEADRILFREQNAMEDDSAKFLKKTNRRASFLRAFMCFILTALFATRAGAGVLRTTALIPTYRINDGTLRIPTPEGFSVASKAFETAYDKRKRAAGGSGERRFVLFVRDASLDSSRTYGDTLSISLNDYSDIDVEEDEFKIYAEELLKAVQTYGNFVLEERDIIQESRWCMFMETKKYKLSQGKSASMYYLSGLVLIDKHLYTFYASIFNPNEALKNEMQKVIVNWLTDISGGSQQNAQGDKLLHRPEFYDIMKAGEGCMAEELYIPEKSYWELFDCEWKEKRTVDLDKAAGLDIKFSYPVNMNCAEGRQPHIVFNISKAFGNPVLHAYLSVGVFPYDETILEVLKSLKPTDIKEPAFLDLARALLGEKGSIIGAGITTMESRSVMWVTQQRESERLGHKFKIISRSFFMPATGGRCVHASFAIIIAGDNVAWPYRDFEYFNTIGLKFINSITFMNKAQIGAANRFDGVASGTGWFVAPEYIITCWHVIQSGAQYSCIKADGQLCSLTLVGKDEFSDLALLRVSDSKDKCNTPLKLADERPKVTQKVFTVGYPIPELMGKAAKYTEGVISSLTGIGDDDSSLQITTPVQSGNSGGPLLNEKCEVVGVIQSTLLTPICNSEHESIQNVNYAAKSYLVRRMLLKYSIDLPKKFVVGDPFETAKNATVFILVK